MHKIYVHKQSAYPVSAQKLKTRIQKTLEQNGVVSESEISLAVVGRQKMAELAKKYLGEDLKTGGEHPVLAFVDNEITKSFVFPPMERIHLGEVVLSYPAIVSQAKKENRLIDEVASDLAEHGTLHLIGIHHNK